MAASTLHKFRAMAPPPPHRFQLLMLPHACSKDVMHSSSIELAILPQYTMVDLATSVCTMMHGCVGRGRVRQMHGSRFHEGGAPCMGQDGEMRERGGGMLMHRDRSWHLFAWGRSRLGAGRVQSHGR